MNEVQKAAVSVSEMARIVGMSRARFYQLMSDGVFPKPKYDPNTNRPYYDEEAQAECVLVKRRNVGINGQVVIFYARRHPLMGQPKRPSKSMAKPKPTSEYNELIELLDELHLSATAQQVEAAVAECFPDGIQKLDYGEVVTVIFRYLKRQESK